MTNASYDCSLEKPKTMYEFYKDLFDNTKDSFE